MTSDKRSEMKYTNHVVLIIIIAEGAGKRLLYSRAFFFSYKFIIIIIALTIITLLTLQGGWSLYNARVIAFRENGTKNHLRRVSRYKNAPPERLGPNEMIKIKAPVNFSDNNN